MDARKHILFVDDDEAYLGHLHHAFASKYYVSVATTIAQADQAMARQLPDVIVLDYLLKDENGHHFLDRFQPADKRPPVIVVSGCFELEMAKGFLQRQIQDFYEKPVPLGELAAAISKFAQGEKTSQQFEINESTRKVLFEGGEILLTPTEYEILKYFLQRPGQQVTRAELVQHLWGDKSVSKNAFDTHLLNLKKKLPPFMSRLTSVYGAGYCYEA